MKEFVVVLLYFWYTTIVSSSPVYYTAFANNGTFVVKQGKDIAGVAWGYYTDTIEENGWGKLYIESNPNEQSSQQIKAAGFLEGMLTQERIYQYNVIYTQEMFSGYAYPTELDTFISDNMEFMENNIKNNGTEVGSYWWHVGLIFDQIRCLTDGYNSVAPKNQAIDFNGFLLNNMNGDLNDLMNAIVYQNNKTQIVDEWKMKSQKELEQFLAFRGRCSALFKLTDDGNDIFAAHSTWGSYWSMLRIIKHYHLPLYSLHSPRSGQYVLASNGVMFTSYPGTVSSDDDFYITEDTDLVVIETTNDMLNDTLYATITPQSVMYWIRASIANRVALSGPEWVNVFSLYNSGTYNDQWMILDYKLFSPGKPLQPNTLTVAEQIPNLILSIDATSFLTDYGYWASFNRPYFTEIFATMGYDYYATKYGAIYSYESNPRALIFERDQASVKTIQDMQNIMTYNNWQTDPLSGGYPGSAISARFDLKGGPDFHTSWFAQGCHGGIDSKVTNFAMAKTQGAVAICGPTTNNITQTPVFDWSACPNTPHVGLPTKFDFDWIDAHVNK